MLDQIIPYNSYILENNMHTKLQNLNPEKAKLSTKDEFLKYLAYKILQITYVHP